MSDDRVSWFDSQAVKAEHIRGPYLHLIFFTVSYENKEECCFLYFFNSTRFRDVHRIRNLENALRMETNHKTKNTSAERELR